MTNDSCVDSHHQIIFFQNDAIIVQIGKIRIITTEVCHSSLLPPPLALIYPPGRGFWFLLHLPISQLPFLGVAGDVVYIGDSFPIGALMTILQAVPLCVCVCVCGGGVILVQMNASDVPRERVSF